MAFFATGKIKDGYRGHWADVRFSIDGIGIVHAFHRYGSFPYQAIRADDVAGAMKQLRIHVDEGRLKDLAPLPPAGCQRDCRGDYDNGGFACPNAPICGLFGEF